MMSGTPVPSIVGAIIALIAVCEVSAQSGFPDDPSVVWRKTGGPIGGLGYNVRYVPGAAATMFVTDGWAGVQRSTDGGQTWTAMNEGITSRSRPSQDAIPVFALRIDPNDPDIVWAGLLSGKGLFRSTDRGLTYESRSFGLPLTEEFTVRHIEVEPGNSDRVYVMGEFDTGVWGEEFARTRGFVYASDDGGATWSPLGGASFPFPSLTRWLWIDPADPDTMLVTTGIFDREADTPDGTYASGPGVGVYRTTDGGETWTPSNAGMDPDSSLFVGGFDRHPTQPGTLMVATGNNADLLIKGVPGAVYRSVDGGLDWTEVTPPPQFPGEFEAFTAVAYAPSNGNILYVGSASAIHRSANGGTTWTRHGGPGGAPWGPPGIRSGVPIDMVVAPDDPDTLYINNYGGGVFKSDDGGASWQVWSEGYTGADINQVAVRPGVPEAVLANGRSGCFVSSDAGVTWKGLANGLGAIPEGSAVAFDPADPSGNTILMGDERAGSILRTTNGGATWSEVLELPGVTHANPHGLRPIAFAPSDSSTVYAGFCQQGLHADPHELDFSASFGVYRSTNGGQTWAAANGDLPNPVRGRNVTALAVSHQDPDTVYLGLREGGVYKTTDGGSTWTHVTAQSANDWTGTWPTGSPVRRDSILSLAIDPNDDDVVYAGTNLFGLYRTGDGGATWVQIVHEDDLIAQATEDHAHVFSVVVNPQDPDELYLGEWHGGIYRSSDGGSNWARINTGLSTRAVQSLAISDDGSTVYAGVKGEGVFRNRLDNQSIEFPPIGGGPFQVGGSVSLAAIASSGLPVFFTSSNPAVASVSGGTLTFHAAGSVEIVATQAGDATSAAAAPRTRLLSVVAPPPAVKRAQTIRFTTPKAPRFKPKRTFVLKARASSGLRVAFSTTTRRNIQISGTRARMLKKGVARVVARQPGNAAWLPARPVTRTLRLR